MVGENQIFSNPPLKGEQLQKLMQSPQTAQLLRILQQDGGLRLQQAAQAMREGRTEDAKALLSPLLEQSKAADLTKQLEAEL